jgi:ABC-type bacteriocin/lantibiotic exporter with double-glycine peptidase domain
MTIESKFLHTLSDQINEDKTKDNSLVICLKKAAKYFNISPQIKIKQDAKITIQNLEICQESFGLIIEPIIDFTIDLLIKFPTPLLVEFENDNQQQVFSIIIPKIWGKNSIYNPLTNINQTISKDYNPDKIIRIWQLSPLNFKMATNYSDLVKNILKFFKKDVFSAIILGLLVSIGTIFTSLISGYIFGNLSDGLNSNYLTIFIAAVFTILFSSLITFVSDINIKTLHIKVLLYILPSIWNHILNLPIKISKKFISGDMAQRLLDYETTISSLISLNLVILFDLCAIILLLLYMALCEPLITALYTMIVLIFLALKIYFIPQNLRQIKFQINKQGKLSSFLNEALLGIAKIRSANVEDKIYQKWLIELLGLKDSLEKTTKIEIFFTILDSLMMVILLLSLYGILYFSANDIQPVKLLSFLIAGGQFCSLIDKLFLQLVLLIHLLPGLKRIKPITKEKIEQNNNKQDISSLKGEIILSNLCFQVNGLKPIIDDLSMTIKAGQFVAIIGPTGAGKSTLIKLLLGLENASSGTIMIDKKNINDLNLKQLRKQYGIVLQTTNLLAGTIFSNIAVNNFISVDEALELAKLVGLDDEVKAMPMKLFTHLSDNSSESISGGQKQKILIARALANKPKILFLDEATSALDNHSQKIIHDNLKHLNITRIVIAHRYSTIIDADVIYVMEDGKVVDYGSFDDLVKRKKVVDF